MEISFHDIMITNINRSHDDFFKALALIFINKANFQKSEVKQN